MSVRTSIPSARAGRAPVTGAFAPLAAPVAATLVLLLAGCTALPGTTEAPAPGAPAAALPSPGLDRTAPVDDSLFRALGGHAGIDALMERFIREIAADDTLRPRFRDVNITRFHDMLNEQLCAESGGGCTYTGDDMRRAHAGLDITRAEFNATVEALTRAMDADGLPVGVQNRVLALHAPKRADVLGE